MDYGISTVTIQVTSYPDDVMLHVYIPCLHSNNLMYLVLTTNLFMHSCLCQLAFPSTWNRAIEPNARVLIHIEHGAILRIFSNLRL
jgi:hypothetical protein